MLCASHRIASLVGLVRLVSFSRFLFSLQLDWKKASGKYRVLFFGLESQACLYTIREALVDVVRMILTGGPFFFMFHMGTKAHYFGQTLLAGRKFMDAFRLHQHFICVGGAMYRPTGRGFVTRLDAISFVCY